MPLNFNIHELARRLGGPALPKRLEVELWSSSRGTDGGFTDSCERHGGENNGGAQARLTPAAGKYATLPGLAWMSDVKNFGFSWSGIANDYDNGGAVGGKSNDRDTIKGGPYSRMEHVHVLDCAGYDYLKLYWTGKCLAHEGLNIDLAGTAAAYATGQLVNIAMADVMKVAAAGMPAVDSSDSMFSLPKLMWLNENDTLANEGLAPGSTLVATTTFTAAVTGIVTCALGHMFNGEVVTVSSSVTLPGGLLPTTTYFVVQATLDGLTGKLSLTSGGAAVTITDTGTGVHTMNIGGHPPGSGAGRGRPRYHGPVSTTVHWEPDIWIQGGEPLWAQSRGIYPAAADNWTLYDQLYPAVGFETDGSSPTFTGFQGPNGPPGMFQWGKYYKSADDKLFVKKFVQQGDRYECSMWLGYPNTAYQTTSNVTNVANTTVANSRPLLRITGLARIALIAGAIGVNWHGEGLGSGIVMQNSTRNTNSNISAASKNDSSFLQSVPVGIAAAPRSHIRGRLIAVLTRD